MGKAVVLILILSFFMYFVLYILKSFKVREYSFGLYIKNNQTLWFALFQKWHHAEESHSHCYYPLSLCCWRNHPQFCQHPRWLCWDEQLIPWVHGEEAVDPGEEAGVQGDGGEGQHAPGRVDTYAFSNKQHFQSIANFVMVKDQSSINSLSQLFKRLDNSFVVFCKVLDNRACCSIY